MAVCLNIACVKTGIKSNIEIQHCRVFVYNHVDCSAIKMDLYVSVSLGREARRHIGGSVSFIFEVFVSEASACCN